MPRKTCYWTRKLELELIDFIREREFIWKPVGNTNHHIQQKYKAYAQFAAKQGRGFTACAIRDRWVNIRSTFNHNLRKVERSKMTAATTADMYVPCWPLWKPLQFLREAPKKEYAQYENLIDLMHSDFDHLKTQVKVEEAPSDIDDFTFNIRQRGERADRPQLESVKNKPKSGKCVQVLDDLINAMRPLVQKSYPEQSYWFFGKHIVERLNCMRKVDSDCASRDIMKLLAEWSANEIYLLKPGTLG